MGDDYAITFYVLRFRTVDNHPAVCHNQAHHLIDSQQLLPAIL